MFHAVNNSYSVTKAHVCDLQIVRWYAVLAVTRRASPKDVYIYNVHCKIPLRPIKTKHDLAAFYHVIRAPEQRLTLTE